METNLPLTVTMFGLITVFTALFGLMGALKVMSHLLGDKPPKQAKAPAKQEGGTLEETEDATARLRAVAIAAFAAHQKRRVTVRGPEVAITKWRTHARLSGVNRI